MTIKTVSIFGTDVSAATIGNFKKAANNSDLRLTLWANAGAYQVVADNNKNWLLSLFSTEETRKQDGSLNKLGKDLARYVKTYSGIQVTVNKESALEVKFNFKKNRNVFLSEEKDEDGAPLKINATENKQWPMTFKAFVERDKPAKTTKTKRTAQAMAKTMQDALDILNDQHEKTELAADQSAEDMAALAKSVAALADHLAKFAGDKSPVDLDHSAHEKLTNVVSGKEKRVQSA